METRPEDQKAVETLTAAQWICLILGYLLIPLILLVYGGMRLVDGVGLCAAGLCRRHRGALLGRAAAPGLLENVPGLKTLPV